MKPDLEPTTIILAHEPCFTLGGLEVRPSTRETIAGETREILEPRVMQVLVVLAGARGAVVSRDDLTMRCWGGRVVGEDAITRVIARIRRLSERDAGKHFTLETVRKVGYRLVAASAAAPAVELAPREEPQALPAVPQPEASLAPAPASAPAPEAETKSGLKGWWAKWRSPTLVASLLLIALLSASALALTLSGRLSGDALIAGAPANEAARPETPEELHDRAISLYREAVARQPELAVGWTSLVLGYVMKMRHEGTAVDGVEGATEDATHRVLTQAPDGFGA